MVLPVISREVRFSGFVGAKSEREKENIFHYDKLMYRSLLSCRRDIRSVALRQSGIFIRTYFKIRACIKNSRDFPLKFLLPSFIVGERKRAFSYDERVIYIDIHKEIETLVCAIKFSIVHFRSGITD